MTTLSLPSDDRINFLLERFHVPGLAVGIVNGTDIDARGYGWAITDPPTPCTPHTIFDTASTAKALTSLAVGILVRDGKLKWDTPVVSVLPDDFAMSDAEATSSITVEDLLSHRTGLPTHDSSVLGIKAAVPDTPRSVTRNLRNLPMNAAPKSIYQYSNIMYIVATHVIETISGIPFGDFLKRHIFNKLDMTSSFLLPSAVLASDLRDQFSTPYVYERDRFREAPREETPEAQGSGSIQTTIVDYAKFIRAMINHTDPITDDIYDAVTTPRIMIEKGQSLDQFGPQSTDTAYALGWDVRYRNGHKIVTHSGNIGGYGSTMFFLPEQRVGAYIIGNSENAYDAAIVLQKTMIVDMLDVNRGHDFDPATRILQKYDAQEARRKNNAMRNAKRRLDARGTTPTSLKNYCGTFYDKGYHHLVVQIKDDELFIDCGDRSMPFFMLLEHLSDGTDFRGYLIQDDESEEILQTKFMLSQDGMAVKLGIAFEEEIGKDQLIWFDRQDLSVDDGC